MANTPQALRYRKTSNGKRKTVVFKSIQEAVDVTGIGYLTLYMRLKAGWSVADAINTPVRGYKKGA